MLALRPINLPVTHKHSETLLAQGVVSERLYLPESYVLKIAVENCIKVKDHYEFVIRVQGRSRFLNYLPSPASFVSYLCRARYSDLLELHRTLQNCISPHTSEEYEVSGLPHFPQKKWLASAKRTAEARISQLNLYFDSLFCTFGPVTIFSERLLDFFAPTPAGIMVVAQCKDRRNGFLNALIRRLFRQQPVVGEKQSVVSESVLSTIGPSSISAVGGRNPWKSAVPFDYLRNSRLYRVDVANLYDPGTAPLAAYFESPHASDSLFGVILIVDYASGDKLETATQLLGQVAEGRGKSCGRKPAVLLVGENVDAMHAGSQGSTLVSSTADSSPTAWADAKEEIPGAKRLEKSYRLRYVECSTGTGEGVLEALDIFIDLAAV